MSDSGGCRSPFGQANSMEIAPARGRRFRFDVILREASRTSVGASPARRPRGRGPAVAQGGLGRQEQSSEPPQEKMGAQVQTEEGGRRLNESLIAPSFAGGPGGCSHRWGRRWSGYIAGN